MKFNIKTFRGRLGAYAWSMVVEHNIVNVFRDNFYQISPNAYRSSQPTPYQVIRRAKKYGIKTIVNVRGFPKNSPLHDLEQEACDKAGITLKHYKIYSRTIPRLEELKTLHALLNEIEYPVMFHCKSGADRVGIVSTLYLHWKEGIPLEETNMLKFWPYGHIKGAKTGILDYFIETFLTYKKEHPDAELLWWAENVMERESLRDSFKPEGFSTFIVDKVLNRE